MRRHRLVARTPGSHPGNRGSIPLGGNSYFKKNVFTQKSSNY